MCLHGINDEYPVYFENVTFLSFSKLMEAARQTNEFVEGPLNQAELPLHSGFTFLEEKADSGYGRRSPERMIVKPKEAGP